jgi:hypothetical protein
MTAPVAEAVTRAGSRRLGRSRVQGDSHEIRNDRGRDAVSGDRHPLGAGHEVIFGNSRGPDTLSGPALRRFSAPASRRPQGSGPDRAVTRFRRIVPGSSPAARVIWSDSGGHSRPHPRMIPTRRAIHIGPAFSERADSRTVATRALNALMTCAPSGRGPGDLLRGGAAPQGWRSSSGGTGTAQLGRTPIRHEVAFSSRWAKAAASLNTVKSYVRALALWWQYLAVFGLAWDAVTLEHAGGFLAWLPPVVSIERRPAVIGGLSWGWRCR